MPDLTLVSFNAHAGVRPVGTRSGGEPYDLTGFLVGLDADVLVLQEMWRPDVGESSLDAVAAARGERAHTLDIGRAVLRRWPHLTPAGDGTVSLAVLTRLPARRVGEIDVGHAWGDPAPRRHVLHLELDLGGIPLQLVAVHLTSRLPHGPVANLLRLRPRLPGGPAVLAGDCNFWGPAVGALLPGWRRTVRGRTWPAHRAHSQIDHVLVRGDVVATEAAVLPDVGSDHRPVRVRLRVG